MNEPRRSIGSTRVVVAALSFLLLLTGGCAYIQSFLGAIFKKPTLHFEQASVRDVSLGGLTLDLTWRVENPNDVGFRIDEVSYAFDVEGRRLTSGVQPQGVEVAPRAGSKVTLPFEVRFDQLADSVVTILGRDDIGWLASGSIGFDTPVGLIELPFEREGRTTLPRVPRIALSGARVTNLSLMGATVVLDLGLQNPNAFAIPLDRLNYSVRIGGAEVAFGDARTPRLAARQNASLSLPIQLSFTSAGQAVYDALQSGNAEIGLTGNLSSGRVTIPVNLSRRVNLR